MTRLAIAISLAGVDEAFMSSPDAPVVLKALFPIVPTYCMSFPVGRPDVEPCSRYMYRDAVKKGQGQISTTHANTLRLPGRVLGSRDFRALYIRATRELGSP